MDKIKFPRRAVMVALFAALICLFSLAALVASSMATALSGRVFYGVKARGVELGGLTQAEAKEKLDRHYHALLADRPVFKMYHHGQIWKVSAADIDYAADTEAIAQSAYDAGREANFFTRVRTRVKSAHQGVEIPAAVSYNKDKLKAIVSRIAARTAADPEDAYCSVEGGAVSIVPEKEGRRLDVEAFSAFLDRKLIAIDVPDEFPLPLAVAAPEVKSGDLKRIDSVISVYSSEFNPYNANRSENIKISANSVSRLLVQPGQVVSFNDLVGLRVAEAGFKEAPVIIEGKTVPDIGGGVCQVSSTLYNAILLADLQPVERTPHFHPLGYVPIGLDATVADNLLDFKFKNTLEREIYLVSEVNGGTLTIYVLGSKDDAPREKISLDSTIDRVLKPKTVIEYDAALEDGKRVVKEEGLTGYIVSSYRVKSVNGKEVARELLYTDEYSPENEIVAVGTKPDGPTKLQH